MGQQKLARHVTVAGTTYGPDDDVPADIAKKITNPKAWVSLDEAPTGDPDYSGREPGTASGHKLATRVTIGSRTYGPGDFVPDDVAVKITNPKAWEGGKPPTEPSLVKATEPTPDKGDASVTEPAAGVTAAEQEKPRKAAPPVKRA